MWKDVAVALSLANLCFFGVWSSLLGDFRDPFARLRLSPPAEYAGAILNVLSLAAAFYLVIFSLRRRFRGWRLLAVLGGIAALTWAPAAACYTVLTRYRPRPSLAALPVPGNTVVVIAAASVLLLLLLLPRHYRRIAALLYGVLLVFSPFVGVTFARAGWRMYAAKQGPVLPPPSAEMPRAQPASRVVWVVFDEWDQRLTFEQRPDDLALPELDRLRREALYASAAYAPAEQTQYSMLSTISGGVLLRLEPERGRQLRLLFRDRPEAVLWSEHANLFRRARQEGFRTAVVGWYIPYCALLSDSLDSCWQSDPLGSSGGSSLSRVLAGQWQIVVKKAVFSVSPESLDALHHSQLFDQMLREASKCLTDASLDLVLLHLPIPHGPYFYDRQTGTYRFDMDPVLGYFDALALVDRTVGQFRRDLEAAGLWDQTALLLTSDHWLRTSELIDGIKEHRVPFLLKLAGKSRPAVYEHAFNTVLSHELMLELLRGRLRTPGGVTRWLDQHRESVSIEPVYTGAGAPGT
ncbi:MAG TPA: sulfatase-like hydrolase/transferase [Bryobacteraceae bacterium]|nr:sulfatase-like hydrolase/transferase [Bryobacteraceae bacterium]